MLNIDFEEYDNMTSASWVVLHYLFEMIGDDEDF